MPRLVASGTRTRAESKNKIVSYSGMGTPETTGKFAGINRANFQKANIEAKKNFDEAKEIAQKIVSGEIKVPLSLQNKAISLLNTEASVRNRQQIAQQKATRSKVGGERTGAEVVASVGGKEGLRAPAVGSIKIERARKAEIAERKARREEAVKRIIPGSATFIPGKGVVPSKRPKPKPSPDIDLFEADIDGKTFVGSERALTKIAEVKEKQDLLKVKAVDTIGVIDLPKKPLKIATAREVLEVRVGEAEFKEEKAKTFTERLGLKDEEKFQRVRDLSSLITGGKGQLIEERTPSGQRVQSAVETIAGFVPATGILITEEIPKVFQRSKLIFKGLTSKDLEIKQSTKELILSKRTEGGKAIFEAVTTPTGQGSLLALTSFGVVASKTPLKVTDIVKTAVLDVPRGKFKPTIRKITKVPREKGGIIEIKEAPSVKRLAEPLKVQLERAGQVKDVVSAQRDLFQPRVKEIKVEKPKPTKDAPELERAFFVDPEARVRVSRLGVLTQKLANVKDIVSGEFAFRTKRPQIVLFENVKLADFPVKLQPIVTKLKKGKGLTVKETKLLEEFQLTPTGEFKVPGFLSKEPEAVLAPGEIIIKDTLVGTTLKRGRRVEIIRGKVKQAEGKTRELLLKEEPLSKVEIKELDVRLKKETGLDISISQDLPIVRPSSGQISSLGISSGKLSGLIVPSGGISGITRPSPRGVPRGVPRGTPRITPRITPRPTPRIVPRGAPRIPPRKIQSILPRPPSRVPPRTPGKLFPDTPPPPIILIPPLDDRKIGYNAEAREIVRKKREGKPDVIVEKKFVRLNKKALTKNDALSLGLRAVDNTPAKTFKVVKAGKPAFKGSTDRYWSTNKFKVRGKIRKGKQIKSNEFIEKGKFGIDTFGELEGITVKGWKARRRQTGGLFI